MHQPPHSIALERLRREYGDVTALHDLSLSIEPGQVVALLGPNGAGKSTLMKIITGLIAPTSGSAHIAGIDVCAHASRAREHIGYLPEHVPLYEAMFVHDYLAFMARMRGVARARRSGRIAKTVAQTGLEGVLGQPIFTLSKGYRQRVGIAQAIIHEPAVLVLDEPTTGLDPNQLLEVRELIRRLGAQRTVLFSTHIMQEVAAVCDRVLMLDRGRLVMDASIAELSELARGKERLATYLEQGFRALTEARAQEES